MLHLFIVFIMITVNPAFVVAVSELRRLQINFSKTRNSLLLPSIRAHERLVDSYVESALSACDTAPVDNNFEFDRLGYHGSMKNEELSNFFTDN